MKRLDKAPIAQRLLAARQRFSAAAAAFAAGQIDRDAFYRACDEARIAHDAVAEEQRLAAAAQFFAGRVAA